MELDIKDGPSGLVIRYNGKLVTEGSVGELVKSEEYETEVVRGRVARSLLGILKSEMERASTLGTRPDHAHQTEDKKQAAYFRGMVDGYGLKLDDHPGAGVPPMTLESSRTYSEGYEFGEAIRRCIDLLEARTLKV
jgi:hypothetical protein